MKLRDILNLANDEMWVRIQNEDIHDIWMADYVGEYDETMKELNPFLDKEVEEYWLETFEDPDCGDEAPLMVIKLETIERRSDKEILEDLVEAVKNHEYNRERELDFYQFHGYEVTYWNAEQVEEQERILGDIKDSHDKLQNLIREYNGDKSFIL